MLQEPGHILAGSSASESFMGRHRCQPGLGFHLMAQLVRIHFQGTVVDRTPFLFSCWTEGLNSLLPAGRRPLSVPCRGGLCDVAAHFINVCGLRRRRVSANEMEPTISYHLISEVTSHHLCYIWLARMKLPPLKGRAGLART